MKFGVAPGRSLIKNFEHRCNWRRVAAYGTSADGADGRPDEEEDHEVLSDYLVSPVLLQDEP